MGSRKRPKPNPKGDPVQDPLESGASSTRTASTSTGPDNADSRSENTITTQPVSDTAETTKSAGTASTASTARATNASTETLKPAPGSISAPAASRESLLAIAHADPDRKTPRLARSWYGGTWPRKPRATPTIQLDQESIAVPISAKTEATYSRPITPSSHASENKPSVPPRTPSFHLGNIGPSQRSTPLAAATTKLNITTNASGEAKESGPLPPGNDSEIVTEPKKDGKEEGSANLKPRESDNAASTSTSWLGWIPRPGFSAPPEPTTENTPRPLAPVTNVIPAISDRDRAVTTPLPETKTSAPTEMHEVNSDQQANKFWFASWRNLGQPPDLPSPGKAGDRLAVEPTKPQDAAASLTSKLEPKVQQDTLMADATPRPQDSVTSINPPKSSSWAFWSKEKDPATNKSGPLADSMGELAVADSPTQSHPKKAKAPDSGPSDADSRKGGKRERPKSLEVADDISSKSTPSHSPSRSEGKFSGPAVKQQLQKTLPPNLILPPFKSTYRLLECPSILQQIARLLSYGKQPEVQHVNLVKDPPRIKKAIAIGVHGYFPTPLIRSVLGQPTGTSIRFANSAADAIRKWSEKRGYACEIEKVALEGEGKIAERVDTLWKLLLNWIDHIRKADFVLLACHSQGVPVTMMLVAKLIEFGCINAARVGVCAMAGVNLGPYSDYKSRLFGGSAGELFEFANPESEVSKRYEDAVRIAVKHGVRILYVGSIDDQLVSLESSTFSTINHPYIYRAVFVDGRVHAPDFITHLVGFALKLRNLGISDHGLIRELSAPLAGSLYSGEGHSRLYDDELAYDLAVEHALETSSVGDIPLAVQKYEVQTTVNPYILPWSMRGLLEEEYVRTELDKETAQLLQQFDDWKPTSKVLKDVKFRLEAVKSKL